MTDTLIQPQIGAVRLEKRLMRFVVKRENLDPQNPILDLSKSTIIREQLSNLLLTPDELRKQPARGIAYTERLKFLVRPRDIDSSRILLDARNTMQFNRFLHRLFEELLHEHICNYRQFNKGKSAMNGVDSFLNSYQLTLDDFPDVDFEHDSLIKADYRLRKSRNLIGFGYYPVE